MELCGALQLKKSRGQEKAERMFMQVTAAGTNPHQNRMNLPLDVGDAENLSRGHGAVHSTQKTKPYVYRRTNMLDPGSKKSALFGSFDPPLADRCYRPVAQRTAFRLNALCTVRKSMKITD